MRTELAQRRTGPAHRHRDRADGERDHETQSEDVPRRDAAIAQVWKRPVVDRGWHRASDERKHGSRARPRADGEPRAEPSAELRVRADDRIDPEDVAERGRVPIDQERLAVRVVEDNNPAGREVVARRLEGLAREEE